MDLEKSMKVWDSVVQKWPPLQMKQLLIKIARRQQMNEDICGFISND